MLTICGSLSCFFILPTSRLYGIFQWNGSTQTFTNKSPTVLSSASDLDGVSGATYTGVKASVGAKGDYAIVTFNTENKIWYKNEDNAWVQVGSNDESAFDAAGFGSATTWNSTTWVSSWPTITATLTPTVIDQTNLVINNTQVNNGGTTPESLVQAINGAGITGVGAKVDANGRIKIYSDDRCQQD